MSATDSKLRLEKRKVAKRASTPSSPNASGKIEAVTQHLEERIRSGEWKVNHRLPTQGELSKEYGVSMGSIAIALRNLQKKRLVNIVPNKGTYIVDEKNPQTPEGSARPLIALRGSYVSSSGSNSRVLVGGVVEVANAKSCPLLMLPRSTEGGDYDLGYYRARGVQGVIFLGGESYCEALNLRMAGMPVILANEPVNATPLNFVNYDHGDALRRILKIFIENGHERIAVVFPETSLPGYFEKILPDFLSTLAEHHLLQSNSKDYWQCLRMSDGESARQTVRQLFALPEPPTAIFSLTSSCAALCVSVAKEKGIQVPEDLSVAASCANTEGDAAFTGFVLPWAEVAEGLFDGICKTIDNPFYIVQKLVPLKFVDRHTIGPRKR